MTLTSILPTLRDSIPLPIDRSRWPARSVALLDDVTVAAMSLRRYAELCGTPCTCTAPAVIPLSGGMPSPDASTTVVVATVVDAEECELELDADLEHLSPAWGEMRLIGRISHAYEVLFRISGAGAALVSLPGDIRAGDRIAIPCPGCHTLGEVRRGTAR
ncbi:MULTISPECIES: hypothetical protein [unclassified Microbacterium]|uniref:hypothetical protein n=1 Tax=unclassified Microbacterium TaxID=2609290 RepID=UPI0012F9803D|nr:hypothetical protein [Microbacterium sp. MAH-37]MVQ40637.1 hypothetical protein [Microbacterium sp. MAH-37]